MPRSRRQSCRCSTAISKAYAENPDRARTRGGRDEPLGFGLADGVSLLTPVILAATDAIVRYLAEDVGKALTHAAIELATKWIWALFHREPDAQPLSQAQIAQIRAIVAEKSHKNGKSRSQPRGNWPTRQSFNLRVLRQVPHDGGRH